MRSTNLFIVRGYTGADAKGFDGGKVAKVSVATKPRLDRPKIGGKKRGYRLGDHHHFERENR